MEKVKEVVKKNNSNVQNVKLYISCTHNKLKSRIVSLSECHQIINRLKALLPLDYWYAYCMNGPEDTIQERLILFFDGVSFTDYIDVLLENKKYEASALEDQELKLQLITHLNQIDPCLIPEDSIENIYHLILDGAIKNIDEINWYL